MADRVVPGPTTAETCVNEAVCVHTNKIFDSCRDKDCIEDLRVFPTTGSLTYIDSAFSIRPKSAELIYVSVDVDEINFNRGRYTIDVSYFYNIRGETVPGGQEVSGLAVFDKRAILFGSEGSAKVFRSDNVGVVPQTHALPVAIVEAVDPIALSMKLVDNCPCNLDNELREVPPEILAAMGDTLVLTETNRKWYVTLGQFSIIRLERDTQLLIPAYDYCIPDKECVGSDQDDPCTLFGRIRFPMEEFFPPKLGTAVGDLSKDCP